MFLARIVHKIRVFFAYFYIARSGKSFLGRAVLRKMIPPQKIACLGLCLGLSLEALTGQLPQTPTPATPENMTSLASYFTDENSVHHGAVLKDGGMAVDADGVLYEQVVFARPLLAEEGA